DVYKSQAIVRQMVRAEPGGAGISEAGETEKAASPVTTSPGAETAGIKKNMRRAFGD
ncbi:Mediator of plasmid stability, partial [Escherichia coli]|nr:Mediator of plasmid stability [Escherichia coli]